MFIIYETKSYFSHRLHYEIVLQVLFQFSFIWHTNVGKISEKETKNQSKETFQKKVASMFSVSKQLFYKPQKHRVAHRTRFWRKMAQFSTIHFCFLFFKLKEKQECLETHRTQKVCVLRESLNKVIHRRAVELVCMDLIWRLQKW